jgi:hypothetical protein
MRILRMRVGDSADVQLDANQIDAKPITLYDGPVESLLEGALGTLEADSKPGTAVLGYSGALAFVVNSFR